MSPPQRCGNFKTRNPASRHIKTTCQKISTRRALIGFKPPGILPLNRVFYAAPNESACRTLILKSSPGTDPDHLRGRVPTTRLGLRSGNVNAQRGSSATALRRSSQATTCAERPGTSRRTLKSPAARPQFKVSYEASPIKARKLTCRLQKITLSVHDVDTCHPNVEIVWLRAQTISS